MAPRSSDRHRCGDVALTILSNGHVYAEPKPVHGPAPILAIDPGNELSAWVLYSGGAPIEHGKHANDYVREMLRGTPPATKLAIEMMRPRGMPTSAQEMETLVQIGRFIECWSARGRTWAYVFRGDVKMALCGSMKARDSNVRQALIDRWGGKEKAIGSKKAPGPLYGLKADIWSALAIALVASGEVVR